MDRVSIAKAAAVILLLLGAAAAMIQYLHDRGREGEGLVYFYDLSEQKLFAAPRRSVPPIRGINNEEQDGVRAIVISDNGNARDKKHRRIAYLEKYTAELKAQFEAVQKNGAGQPTSIHRKEVPSNTLVRRLTDKEWYSMDSPEGEKIVSEWNVPNADGGYPVVCVP